MWILRYIDQYGYVFLNRYAFEYHGTRLPVETSTVQVLEETVFAGEKVIPKWHSPMLGLTRHWRDRRVGRKLVRAWPSVRILARGN